MSDPTGKEVLSRLEADGFRAAFLPYHCLAQVVDTYDRLPGNSPDTPFIKNAVRYFREHQPPDISFTPLSFLIVAYPSEPAEIVVRVDGSRIAIPIPPTYLDDSARRKRLQDILASTAKGCQTAHAKGISQKLLAAHCGLGRYGRNNICYIEGLGSFFSLKAFYTDIPCEDVFHPLAFMEACETCRLCRQNCPTGAIGQHSVIDASLCLTMHNESKKAFPDWLSPKAHHALIGCLKCQEICPKNRPGLSGGKRTLALDEAETQALFASESEQMPPELEQKLRTFGLDSILLSLVGRNARFAVHNLQTV